MKMIVQRRLVPLFMLLLCSCASRTSPPAVVDAIDIGRYSGCWYEIATIPMFVQRGCVGTTATYTTKDSSSVRVINRCYSDSLEGSLRQVEGDASVLDPREPAKLQVAFDTWWGVFARGDYWVVLLDPDYRYSVVSGPSRKRLWILSRTAELPSDTLQEIRQSLIKSGFDLSGLEMTRQFPGKDLCAQRAK